MYEKFMMYISTCRCGWVTIRHMRRQIMTNNLLNEVISSCQVRPCSHEIRNLIPLSDGHQQTKITKFEGSCFENVNIPTSTEIGSRTAIYTTR